MGPISWIILSVCALACLGGLRGMIAGPERVKGFVRLLGGALGITVVISFAQSAPSEPEPPNDPVLEACRRDFRKCISQEQLVDYYQDMTQARTSCKQAARKLARYVDADLPFYAFETYFPIERSFATGQISLVEEEAKYQNAYGAMQRTRVKCVYDLTTKQVLEINAAPQ